ncbi:hypothetical protein [Streptomyces sp. NPDC053560]|uniref:hypothetical protein n=1 Tax=Streptomyces sp. NPDC053560 TaxID=3365711 RepID=UPI0037D03212
MEAQFPTGNNEYAAITAVVGILGGVSGGMANVLADTFAPNDPIQNPYVSKTCTLVTAIRLLYKAMFCGPLQRWLGTSATFGRLHVANARGVGAALDAHVVVPRLVCSCYHFYELTSEPDDVARTRAIVDEVSSITSDVARVSYAVAVNPPDLATKEAAIASLMGANFCTGLLQHAEAWLR